MIAISMTEGATVPVATPENLPDLSGRPSAPLVKGERYELGAALGHGGMGEVLAARDVKIGRDVAIKRLRLDDAAVMAKAFLREARIQGRLQHPAIPPVHDLDSDDEGRPFFSMRKLDGVTLAEALHEPDAPRFTRQRMLRAFVDVCNAIELAHSQGVIHLDLKPGNILLGEHGEVYVLDWGIAREIEGDQPRVAIGGTPGYMAPEQVRGQPDLDARVDVYALGCVLYEILTGRMLHPHGAEGMTSALQGVSIADPELPPELAFACRRATAVQREARIARARDLGDVVQRYLDGDRDLERRRELALDHLEAARDALDGPGHEHTRRSTAMREAGRALALDPTSHDAADLLGRIMLEPPTTPPAELVRLQAQHDSDELRLMARISFGTNLMQMILIVPLLLLLGVRDTFYLPAYTALFVIMGIAAGIGSWAKRTPGPSVAVYIVTYVIMIGFLARMFTPFLMAPGAAAVSAASFAFNPVSRRRGVTALVTLALIADVIGVWLAEVTGLLSRTIFYEHGGVVFRPPLAGIESAPLSVGLCVFTVTMLIMSSACAQVMMVKLRHQRAQLDLHAWHLRQLLSTSR